MRWAEFGNSKKIARDSWFKRFTGKVRKKMQQTEGRL